jgi:hypothetical protein
MQVLLVNVGVALCRLGQCQEVGSTPLGSVACGQYSTRGKKLVACWFLSSFFFRCIVYADKYPYRPVMLCDICCFRKQLPS